MLQKSDSISIHDKNYFYLLAHLTAMPFHHLVSAESLLSALSSDLSNSDQLSIPSIYESPYERLKLFQKAVTTIEQNTSKKNGHKRTSLDRFIQFGFTDNDSNSRKVEIDWQVIFNDELQGCAEIYRAEMMIFKRLLYETGEELKSSIELTNEIFPQYLDYELFDKLTGNETEKLLLNSLSANYQMSVTTIDNYSDENSDEEIRHQNKKNAKNRASDSEANLTVSTRRSYGWESLKNDQNDIAISTEIILDKYAGKYSVNEFNKSAGLLKYTNKLIGNDNFPTIYKFSPSAYWSRWRQAARLAKFDFDFLKTFKDAQTIRFYELTKLLRLSSFNEELQYYPSELKINYHQLTLMMPLPIFTTENEIKDQIQHLTKPLEKANYVKLLSINNFEMKTKNPVIVFRFI